MIHRAVAALVASTLVLSSSLLVRIPVRAAGVPNCRAVIAAPSSAAGGSPVSIADKSLAPKGTRLTSRAWFFGDGSAASGKSASALVHHTYPTPAATMTKHYTIRLILSYADGARCSASASIEIYNGKHLKGYTKLDLRGSTITVRDIEPVPNCGSFDATMHWQPQFGIERMGPDGLPNLLLFGTAHIHSKGANDSTPLPVAVFFSGPIAVTGSAGEYGMGKEQESARTQSCSKKIELTGFARTAVFMLPPGLVTFKSGATKLKCTPAKAGRAASCKIDPSKTLTVVGSERIDNVVFFNVDLQVHFPKKTCTYVGPANVSPIALQKPTWYKC
ncbi:MAG: hypothetical protein PXZ07_05670 [Candidatus Eremiobacteraeota bacterium]|nr:hypothetical protein [Candidatus Eremiobacteraeota bacterium]